MIRRHATAFALITAITAIASCKNNPSKLDDWPPRGPIGPTTKSEDKTAQEQGVDAPPKRDPVTTEKLEPIIHELGPDNVVPTTIVIQLAQPIIDKVDVGNATVKSRLKITPDIPGRLAYTGVSELTFTPS